MREYLHTGTAGGTAAGTSLFLIINRMIGLLPKSANGKTLIVNEIGPDLFTSADEKLVAPVIEELLRTVFLNARNGRIHINAWRFRDIIMMEIEERNNYNGYALAYSIRNLEPLARVLGGYINIKGQQQLTTTVSFSFPDQSTVLAYQC